MPPAQPGNRGQQVLDALFDPSAPSQKSIAERVGRSQTWVTDAVHDGAFGSMVALRADSIVRVPLAEAVGELKLVDPDLYHGVAEVFFG